jgi:hypothetical protein
VKVTEVPEQIVVADAAILNVGVTALLTAIVIEFDVAVGVDKQVAVEVITHVTISELFNVVLVKVEAVPTLTPLTFH